MSTALATDPIIEKIKVLNGCKQEKAYNFFDLTFRVDLVGNDANGGKNDYANLAATSWEELYQKLAPGDKFFGNRFGPSHIIIWGVLGGMESTCWGDIYFFGNIPINISIGKGLIRIRLAAERYMHMPWMGPRDWRDKYDVQKRWSASAHFDILRA